MITLFNRILSTGKYPLLWSFRLIVPVHKKDDPSKVEKNCSQGGQYTLLYIRYSTYCSQGGQYTPFTYIHTYIWCLIHRTSTYLQINLQLYTFLALRVNYFFFVSFHSNHVYALQLFSVTQHYYQGDLAATKIYFLSTFWQLGF